jgi:alkylation response protein AidB-like acyl-CoA dehydrogenase
MKKPKRLFRNRPIDHGKLFRQALADVEAESRAARAEMDRIIGPIPPGADKLRKAAEEIDPTAIFSVETPDGQVVTTTGATLVAMAKCLVAMVDAHEAGDAVAHRRACLAFLEAL